MNKCRWYHDITVTHHQHLRERPLLHLPSDVHVEVPVVGCKIRKVYLGKIIWNMIINQWQLKIYITDKHDKNNTFVQNLIRIKISNDNIKHLITNKQQGTHNHSTSSPSVSISFPSFKCPSNFLVRPSFDSFLRSSFWDMTWHIELNHTAELCNKEE